jgi:hypothetical protein
MTPSGIEPATFRFVAQNIIMEYAYKLSTYFIKRLNLVINVFAINWNAKELYLSKRLDCGLRVILHTLNMN